MLAIGGTIEIRRVDHLTGKLDIAQMAGTDDAAIADGKHFAVVWLETGARGHLGGDLARSVAGMTAVIEQSGTRQRQRATVDAGHQRAGGMKLTEHRCGRKTHGLHLSVIGTANCAQLGATLQSAKISKTREYTVPRVFFPSMTEVHDASLLLPTYCQQRTWQYVLRRSLLVGDALALIFPHTSKLKHRAQARSCRQTDATMRA